MNGKRNVFLTAEWNHLIMANYPVDPGLLKPYLPFRTELDEFNGQHFVSFVGFVFDAVKIKGFPIPFHTRFPEVNLRFYVRFREDGKWKRGVVFISEIVPKPAISFVANTLFNENYITLPMSASFERNPEATKVTYRFRKKRWHELSVVAEPKGKPLVEGSEAAFITEHFWGYSINNPQRTVEYEVGHRSWKIFAVRDYRVDCEFGLVYPPAFANLSGVAPASIFLAEGSPIVIYSKRFIT